MRTSTRKKIYMAAGAVVIALALAGTVIFSMTGDSEAQAPQGQSMEMGGMDMGGMSMDGSIKLDKNELSTFGVTFGTADVRPLSRTIRAVGMVEFDERRMSYVSPKFSGWVEKLHVDFTGQAVRKGQPLLEVYSPELVAAQEELLLAVRMASSVGQSEVRNVASGAEDLLNSARRRLAYWDISDAQIRRLVETGEVRKTLTLYAPASGIVMAKDVVEGQAFRSGHNMYMIADLSGVWVNAEVFEADAALVREGMPAEVAIAALPGRPLSGRIEYVYPTVKDRTRSMRARISIPNPSGELKPGMYATVVFRPEVGEVLTVPSSAVLYAGEKAMTFVDMGGGSIMPHEVTTGVRGERYVQILEGVEPGQRVVTSAQFLLDSESNLAEVMKAMMVEMGMDGMDMEGMDGMDMDGMDMDGGSDMDMDGMDMDGGSEMDMGGMDMDGGSSMKMEGGSSKDMGGMDMPGGERE